MSRFMVLLIPFLVSLLGVDAGIFGGDSASTTSPTATTSSASSSAASPSTSTSSEVAFLQILQQAQIASLDCLITLVNMTQNPIGTCLGLPTLATLVVNPSASGNSSADFATQLNSYLTTVCSASQCSSSDLSEASAQLSANCGSGSTASTNLVEVLSGILTNYETSYRTLACSVHFNGTSALCLSDTLGSSTTSNSNTFFDALVAGSGLNQYQSVFTGATCSGCMYEMYKAAVYTIPGIRGNNITTGFGDHLKNDCPSSTTSTGNTTVDWSDVEDQQIPDALQVSQSTATAQTGDSEKRYSLGSLTNMTSLTILVMIVGGLSVVV